MFTRRFAFLSGFLAGGATVELLREKISDKSFDKSVNELLDTLQSHGVAEWMMDPFRRNIRAGKEVYMIVDSNEVEIFQTLERLTPVERLRVLDKHPEWNEYGSVSELETVTIARLIDNNGLTYRLPTTKEVLQQLDARK